MFLTGEQEYHEKDGRDQACRDRRAGRHGNYLINRKWAHKDGKNSGKKQLRIASNILSLRGVQNAFL
jgi:hypothetical protein